MKFTIASTTFFSLLMMFTGTTTDANEQVKYTYKENSNTAYSSFYWQEDSCVDFNSFYIFATDGYVKQSGTKKITFKSVSGGATYFTNCKSTGATRNELSFYSTDPVTGLTITALTNVTTETNVTAIYSKSLCVIESYEYFNSETGELEKYSSYLCGDDIDIDTKNFSIDLVMTLPKEKDASSDYTSIQKGVNRGPGYFEKFESKSRCKSAVTTKKSFKLGKKVPFVIPDSAFTYADICKVQFGNLTRIMFTDF